MEFRKRDDGFYWMTASPIRTVAAMTPRKVSTLEDNIVMRWHLKLAHLNEAAMMKMVREDLADGMNGHTFEDFKKTPVKCMACETAKAKRMAFKRQLGKRAKECGTRLMSDLCYDEASRFKWVFLLQKKSQAADNVITLVRQLEKDFKVKVFSCDQGGES
ncbi:hypothetical protein C6341_g16352 [Phytophthora cactorum]|nr:hypothetical protein PC120_g14134 [Phytophthora cactorum]KAG3152159.1 hypothetical protein C6341_g16352 [Phytophthora cactorum]KAG4054018.1 hypothetical protein PC123_g10844 [Phytophthora cactorum]